jgi:hypothetical protein
VRQDILWETMDIAKHLIHLINAKITVQQQENALHAHMDIF